jgi:hypothetical protein
MSEMINGVKHFLPWERQVSGNDLEVDSVATDLVPGLRGASRTDAEDGHDTLGLEAGAREPASWRGRCFDVAVLANSLLLKVEATRHRP